MMNLPNLNDAIFSLDPEAGLTPDNKWKDSGKNGIHWTPNANFAAPNYGIFTGPNNAKAIRFNGANQRATLGAAEMARFYAVAPRTECTFVVAARFNAPAVSDLIFDARLNVTGGLQLAHVATSAEKLTVRMYDGATSCSAYNSVDAPLTQRTRVVVISDCLLDANPAHRAVWLDGQSVTALFAGTGTQVTYSLVTVPSLGSAVAGGNYFDGDLFFIGLWPYLFSTAQAVDLSNWLRE